MPNVGSAPISEISCNFRIKKKIESDINELEMALDHANKANAEAAKQIKRHAATLLDVDTACEEENRARLDIEDQVGMADRKGNGKSLSGRSDRVCEIERTISSLADSSRSSRQFRVK